MAHGARRRPDPGRGLRRRRPGRDDPRWSTGLRRRRVGQSDRCRRLSGPRCPVESEHHVELSRPLGGDPVRVVSVSCPSCTGWSEIDELGQIVAAWRRTLGGIARLPAATQTALAAAGVLARLHQSTVIEVREATERCRERIGIDPPPGLVAVMRAACPDRAQVVAVLDAAGDWVVALRGGP